VDEATLTFGFMPAKNFELRLEGRYDTYKPAGGGNRFEKVSSCLIRGNPRRREQAHESVRLDQPRAALDEQRIDVGVATGEQRIVADGARDPRCRLGAGDGLFVRQRQGIVLFLERFHRLVYTHIAAEPT